jgi:hypothetical protein
MSTFYSRQAKKYNLLTLVCFLVFSNLLNAQNSYTLIGQVKNKEGVLMAGNALALSVSDSSLIKGTFFFDGVFELSGVNEKEVLLKITSIEINDTLFLVTNNKSKNDLGTITVSQKGLSLDEVVVTASVPLFEQTKGGATKVNVKKTMLGSSTSVSEVLSKSPNVLVGSNGASVVGKGEALIYLNGKEIPYERLSSIQVNRVESIEIITNPSAKYDAEGRAIINIITVPNHSEGIQGALIQNSTMAKHFLSSSAVNLSYRKGKWSLKGDYGANFGKDWNQSKTKRTFDTDQGIFVSDINHEENTRLTYTSNYSFGVGYQINKNNDISVEYDGLYNVFDLDVRAQNNSIDPVGFSSGLNTVNDGQTVNKNNSITLNYNSNLDTLGSTFFAGGQYSNFNTNLNDLIAEEIYENDRITYEAIRNNVGSNDIIIATPQVDYNRIFKNGGSLEMGSKYSYANNRGRVDFYSKANKTDEFIILPQFSNDFEYTENIPAAYLQFNGELKGKMKINYSFGLRSEYTSSKGVTNVLDSIVIDTNYVNVFPNMAINGNLSKNWKLGFSYSARINRPQYQDLDPFIWYQDSLTSVQGNPFLKSELTQAFESTISLKKYSLKIGYNYSTNSFRYAVFPGGTGVNSVVLKKINVNQVNSYFGSLTIPFEVKFWKMYNTLSLTFDQIIDERTEFKLNKITPQFYFYSYNEFKVKKWFNIELYGEYVGEQNDGIYFREATGSVSFGLSKNFFKNALTCRFIANDVLKTYEEVGSYELGQTSTDYTRKLNTNFYRLSIVYYFGKLWNVVYRNKATGDEEFNRINQ